MFTLVVTSHGRWEYLERALDSLATVGPFDRAILSFDGCSLNDDLTLWPRITNRLGMVEGDTHLLSKYDKRQGLTANLAQAWGALTTDDEWVFHVEEDFIVRDAPLTEMAATLDAFPQVANMVLVRQPWNAQEQRFGSVLPTIPGLEDRGGWLEHRTGFWLNPFVAHASLLRSLCPGVERKLTDQCLSRGLSFGYWGGRNDEPRCEHIGAEGGMGSPGWKS